MMLSATPLIRPSHFRVIPFPTVPYQSGGSTPSGVTPAQMRHFYGVDQIAFRGAVGDGTGQTIAIVDPYDDPNAQSDLQAFDAAFNLADPPSFIQVDQNGGSNLPSTDPNGPGQSSWEVEESLDIEWAHVIAPAAAIVLVEADSPDTSDLFQGVTTAASMPGVSVVSLSLGGPEDPNETQFDPTFTTPAGHDGVTFLAATGDSGSPGGYPAYSPNVVAVGGTSITLGAGGSYGSESGWSGSGGGFSRYEPKPAYQQSVQTRTTRSIPDVSIDANPATGVPVYDSYDFGSDAPWAKIGGTSLATPMWAGLIAIADQGRALAGMPSLDGPTQTLPRLYALPQSDFHDITAGSNGGFRAGPGYDEVTGRGSPVANLLVSDLAGVPAAATVVARYVFYNNSVFDGNDPSVNAADDAAIATDKSALRPGQTAAYSNITSYSKGINGIMIDVKGLAGALTVADFSFQAGNGSDPSAFTAAPAPSAVVVRAGAGTSGSDRIEITWPDGSLVNEWLQVTVNSDAATGLLAPDVFYFGNLVGQAGEPPAGGQFIVTGADETAARNDPHPFFSPAPITDPNDFNRDGKIDATDQLLARDSIGNALAVLAPPAPAAATARRAVLASPALPLHRMQVQLRHRVRMTG